MLNETWKAIENTNGIYEVSNLGRVRSNDRMVQNRWRLVLRRGIILKSPPNAYGYPSVVLSFNSKQTTQTVHRLVATAFLEKTPIKKEVNHKDGNKTNNNVSNLEWSDRVSNMRHAAENNLMKTERQQSACKNRSKINFDIAENIRESVRNGMSQDKAAKQFGTHQATVSKIVRNLMWRKQ